MQQEEQTFGRAHERSHGVARVTQLGDDPNDRAQQRVGLVLSDKWKLERLLGVGGMGAVYGAVHRNGAKAAVKVLHRELAKHEDVRSRFLREGYAANRVEHPGVVKVLDEDLVSTGPDSGTAYLVMELLEGESLEARCRRGLLLSERDFLVVAEVVLEILDVAHRAGVVHRDIKPDNIFITRHGNGRDRVKLLDFGLARLLEGQANTVHGIALGTPPFMSPEQASGKADAIDGRTDLFALAASGFRLVTGRRIHEGTTFVDLVQKMAKLSAPRVRTVEPQLSPALANVLDHALEFRREDRYENAAAMRADVQAALTVVGEGSARVMPLGAIGNDPSVELSASDLEVVRASGLHELGFLSGIELSASDVEVVRGPRAGDIDATNVKQVGDSGRVSMTEPIPTVHRPPTNPPQGPAPVSAGASTPPVASSPVASPRVPMTQPMPASEQPVGAFVPPPPVQVVKPRVPMAAALVGLGIAAFLVMVGAWTIASSMNEADDIETTSKNIAPLPTSHLGAPEKKAEEKRPKTHERRSGQ